LLIAILINIIMFIPAYKFKTDKLTDLSYSLSFIILVLIALVFNGFSFLNLFLGIIIIVWALRLGTFLFIRIRKLKKDKRFDGIRENFFSFLKFWVLQGLAVWVILIPSLIFFYSDQKKVFFLGFIIWLIGLIIESIADIQKFIFKQNNVNKNKFINKGLWKYSRHPNYFGEILCWLGIYVFVFTSFTIIEKSVALISPLFISVLLIFGTGIPQLEKYADKKWGNTKAYKEYKRKTSILIPWFIKK